MSLPSRKRELWQVNKYLWISLCFAGAWLTFQSAHYSPSVQIRLAWVFAGGLTSVAIRSIIAYRSDLGTSGRWGWLFTAIDIALIAAIVRLTGGIRSELWLFYFLVVITETLSVSIKAELALFLLVFSGYAVALWPFSDPIAFVTRLFFLYVVGSVGRRLYQNAEERNRQVARLREQLVIAGEKSRVARELHDGLGREMVNVILGLEVARRVVEKQPDQAAGMLEENIALLRTAMDDTRDLIFQTRPWTLEGDGIGLRERIRRYALTIADRSRLTVSLDCEFDDGNLRPEVAFGLLRILQEALNNVVKHAQATRVDLSICRDGNRIEAVVQDNGIGFAPVETGDGIGLRVIQERAAELGGSAEIRGKPGEGTTVTCRLPCV